MAELSLSEIEIIIDSNKGKTIIWNAPCFELLENEWKKRGGYTLIDGEGVEYKEVIHRWDVQDELFRIDK